MKGHETHRPAIERVLRSTTSLTALGAAAAVAVAACRPAPGNRVSPSSAPASGSGIAAALARAGYVGNPFRFDSIDLPIADAKIDAKAFTVLLDAGFPGDVLIDTIVGALPGLHPTKVVASWSRGMDSDQGLWATLDRLRVGALPLDSLAVLNVASPHGGVEGFIGVAMFTARQAVFDYATNTFYLRAAPKKAPAEARPAPARAKTLRAALEAAGQYGTFLTLMRETGLLPLLEGTVPADTALDSLSWRIRFQALVDAGADTIPFDRHREAATAALRQRQRRSGQLTAFVPTDRAFAQLPPGALDALRADTAQMARLLRGHLLTDATLDLRAVRVLVRSATQPGTGTALGFHVLGPRTDVDRLDLRRPDGTEGDDGRIVGRATIVQPDLTAANGVVHGIDRVLGPWAYAPVPPYAALLARRGYVALPLARQLATGHYYVRATVNGVPSMFFLDTGDSGDRLNIPPGATLAVDSVTTRLGAPASSASSPADQAAPTAYGGVIGTRFLREYRAVVDFGTGTLYLHPDGTAKP